VTLVSLATVSARFERISRRICGGQSGNETGLLVFRVSSDNRPITAPMIHIYSPNHPGGGGGGGGERGLKEGLCFTDN
jgi:hypothetical protein